MMRCAYCEREIGGELQKTKDHIIPRSAGGKKTVPCCRPCNRWKTTYSLSEWAKIVSEAVSRTNGRSGYNRSDLHKILYNIPLLQNNVNDEDSNAAVDR